MKTEKDYFKISLGVVGILSILLLGRLLLGAKVAGDDELNWSCIGPWFVVGILMILVGFNVIKVKSFDVRGKIKSSKNAKKWLMGIVILLMLPCGFYGATYFWSALDGQRAFETWDIYVIFFTGIMFIIGLGLAKIGDL